MHIHYKACTFIIKHEVTSDSETHAAENK